MRWIIVLAPCVSACAAQQSRSMGQATDPHSRTYSQRSQYQGPSQMTGPFDVGSDPQQRVRPVDREQQMRQEGPGGVLAPLAWFSEPGDTSRVTDPAEGLAYQPVPATARVPAR